MACVLYGARGSGSSIIEAACAEIGLDLDVRDLDARHGEHRGEAYAALNPHRKMPALELDDGEVLTESVAILLTLDERHPDAELLPPPGSRARARALRWMMFLATELYPVVEIIDYPERFVPSGSDADPVRDQAKRIWHERWPVVEHGIAGSPYCVDTGFSATDLYIAVLSRWDMDPAWRREHLPRVEALTAAVRARPAAGRALARHFG